MFNDEVIVKSERCGPPLIAQDGCGIDLWLHVNFIIYVAYCLLPTGDWFQFENLFK